MDPIAYLYRKMIGDHWFEIAENPQSFSECDQYLDAKLKSIPEGKSFIFLADPHYYKGHTLRLSAMYAR